MKELKNFAESFIAGAVIGKGVYEALNAEKPVDRLLGAVTALGGVALVVGLFRKDMEEIEKEEEG